MAGSQRGATKAAAKRLGISLEAYDAQRASGHKWCSRGRHWQPIGRFGSDADRRDGVASICGLCRRALSNARYRPKHGPRPLGRRHAPARAGDRIQARGRVNYLVNVGLIPDPDDIPCSDCGHVKGDGRRHNYDHHLGYAGDHHEDVQAVCTRCHEARAQARGERGVRQRDSDGRYVRG